MIGSVDVEYADSFQLLHPFYRPVLSFDLAGMEKDGGIAIALQNVLLHAFVAGLVAAFAAGCIDQDLALGNASCRIEKELAALQLEGAMGCMEAPAEGPADLSLRRIQGYLESLILRLCQQGIGDDQSCDDA